MKKIASIVLCMFLSNFSFAKPQVYKDPKYTDLINAIEQKKQNRLKKIKLFQNVSGQLLKFTISPNQPKVKEDITFFIQPITGFTDSEIILEALFDQKSITANLAHPTFDMWIYHLGSLTEIKNYNLQAKIFIQDKNSASLLREAIYKLVSEIEALNQKISQETDSAIISQLRLQRDDKSAQKDDLVNTLLNLKTEVATENFSFDLKEDQSQTEYPQISSVSPNAINSNTATDLIITGFNFNATSAVKVSGQMMNIFSRTATELKIRLQPLPPGLYDLEVINIENNVIKNTILKNALFIQKDIQGDPTTPPTAIITVAHKQENLGVAIQASSQNSFDSNHKNLRFEWKFISTPQMSNQAVSLNPISTYATFNFTPDVPGFYILELKAFQTQDPFLISSPAYYAIEILAPANRAPVIQQASISALINQSVQKQLQVYDQDFWQAHKFVITKNPNLGSATISSDGLITFNAGSVTGADTIEVTVYDNGNPILNHVISIPINVVATNLAPVISSVFVQNRSQDLPIRSLIAVQGVSDPDGTISEIKVVMGDGTTEYAPVSGPNFGLVIHNYFSYATYNATAYIKDNLGAVTTYPFTVNVTNTDSPIPKFFVNQFSCSSAPCTISADATLSTDSNGIVQYRWLWGDNSVEEFGGITYMSRLHTFNSVGTYKIRLRVRDQYLSQAEGFATVYVGVPAPTTGSPSSIAYVPASSREILVNTPYMLDASRSFDPNPNGALTNFSWNFNCVNSSCQGSGVTTSVTYSEPTNYNPILTVTNALGGTTFGYGSAEITTVNAGHAPKSIMTVNNQVILFTDVIGTAPLTVNLDSSKSFDYDGSINSRYWDFGDGTFNDTNAITVQKIYSTAGVYFVMLAVKDNDGNYMRLWQKIIVNPAIKNNSSLMAKQKSPKDFDEPSNDQEQALSNSCGEKNAMACFELSKIYQARGDTFVADQLKNRSCQLGYVVACGLMKVWK
jgi:PKD domain/IPT/TIG domain/Bacterial Ig domain